MLNPRHYLFEYSKKSFLYLIGLYVLIIIKANTACFENYNKHTSPCDYVSHIPSIYNFKIKIINSIQIFPPFHISCNIRKNSTIHSSLLICD